MAEKFNPIPARLAHMRNGAVRNAADPVALSKAVRIVRAGLQLGLVRADDLIGKPIVTADEIS